MDDDTLPTAGEDVLTALRATARRAAVRVVDAAGDSDIGLVRTHNEDAWAIDGPLHVVCDGMGGQDGGALAATTAVAGLRHSTEDGGWRDRLERLNREVRSVTKAAGHEAAGATVVLVEVADHHAVVAWAGDSRAYLLRAGELELLTHDHTLREALYSAGLDDDQQAGRGLRLHGLTSYLGASARTFTPDVREVGLVGGDRLLLCTDGVHRAVGRAELRAAAAAPTCGDGVAALLEHAQRAGGRDNATAILLEVR